jgi:[protein-PII] uridylyltransferase
MTSSAGLEIPITDPAEVAAFVRGLPLAMDPGFAGFILGFPHRYLQETPRAEVVKHYALAGSLRAKPVVSSLARGGLGGAEEPPPLDERARIHPARAKDSLWKLCVITRDRRFLFSRIAGALSCFGMNIVAAEAFANASAVVLDTFRCRDDEGRFEDDALRRRFQVFLEEAVEGKADLETRLSERLGREGMPAAVLEADIDDEPDLHATRLRLRGPDRFGLLYSISRRLSEAGADIALAEIETVSGLVRDEFLLTRAGAALGPQGLAAVEEALRGLATVTPPAAGSRTAPS